jgi:hypothetical protein
MRFGIQFPHCPNWQFLQSARVSTQQRVGESGGMSAIADTMQYCILVPSEHLEQYIPVDRTSPTVSPERDNRL